MRLGNRMAKMKTKIRSLDRFWRLSQWSLCRIPTRLYRQDLGGRSESASHPVGLVPEPTGMVSRIGSFQGEFFAGNLQSKEPGCSSLKSNQLPLSYRQLIAQALTLPPCSPQRVKGHSQDLRVQSEELRGHCTFHLEVWGFPFYFHTIQATGA